MGLDECENRGTSGEMKRRQMGHDGRMTATGFIRQEALCVGEDEPSVIDETTKKNERYKII